MKEKGEGGEGSVAGLGDSWVQREGGEESTKIGECHS